MEVFGLAGEFEGAVAVAKKTHVFRVANPLTFDGGEFFDNSLGPIRRAVIEDDEPVRAKRLARDRLQGLANEPFAIVDGNDSD